MPFISPDPRSRPPGGVTHRENAPRNTAAHRGKRQPRSPRPAGGELPRETGSTTATPPRPLA